MITPTRALCLAMVLSASPLAAQDEPGVRLHFAVGSPSPAARASTEPAQGTRAAQSQPSSRRRWADRHRTLFFVLVGGSLGASVGAGMMELTHQPGSASQNQAGTIVHGAVFGCAVGALIGVVVAR